MNNEVFERLPADSARAKHEEGPATVFGAPAPYTPRSSKQQSWGAVISIIIIVLMVTIGAFYAWGKRIAEQYDYPAAAVIESGR